MNKDDSPSETKNKHSEYKKVDSSLLYEASQMYIR